jgi:hypothetical protein
MFQTTRPLLLSLCSILFVFALSGECGDDGGPNVELTDSGPADADTTDAGSPDAFVCTFTECGNACIDTTTDSLNCGGCGLTCESAGQICSGSLPCACPADFVPASIGPTIADQVGMQGPAYAAVAPVTFSPLNIVAVAYDLTLTTATDYDLADSLANVAVPSIALGYDVDFASQNAKTAYAATEGIINFDTICAGGASGTVTDVVFAEIGGVANPAPVTNGCSLEYDTLTFDIGTCPDS